MCACVALDSSRGHQVPGAGVSGGVNCLLHHCRLCPHNNSNIQHREIATRKPTRKDVVTGENPDKRMYIKRKPSQVVKCGVNGSKLNWIKTDVSRVTSAVLQEE